MADAGRPAFTDEWYALRLEEMRPILCQGNSLNYAANKTGNEAHIDVFYDKYKANDWFSRKVDAFRALPGELINNVLIKTLTKISDKTTKDEALDRNDIEVLKLLAEKHRSAQPFFVTRTETAQSDPNQVGKILDRMETDYAELGQQASKQMVETNPPIQDQDQNG